MRNERLNELMNELIDGRWMNNEIMIKWVILNVVVIFINLCYWVMVVSFVLGFLVYIWVYSLGR